MGILNIKFNIPQLFFFPHQLFKVNFLQLSYDVINQMNPVTRLRHPQVDIRQITATITKKEKVSAQPPPPQKIQTMETFDPSPLTFCYFSHRRNLNGNKRSTFPHGKHYPWRISGLGAEPGGQAGGQVGRQAGGGAGQKEWIKGKISRNVNKQNISRKVLK